MAGLVPFEPSTNDDCCLYAQRLEHFLLENGIREVADIKSYKANKCEGDPAGNGQEQQ